MIKIIKFINIYFLVLYLVFALSNSVDIYGWKVKEGIFPEIYVIKHLSVLFLSLIGFLLIFVRKKLSIVFIFITAFVSYIKVSFGIIFIQYILFLFSAYALSFMFNKLSRLNFIVMCLIAFSIPAFNILYSNGDFIYNNYYGRERLLLGYIHPKEAAIMIFVLALYFLITYRIGKIFKFTFHLFCLSLLFFIQSRNVFFLYINFLLFSFLRKKFGFKVFFVVFAFYIIAIVFLIVNFYEYFNLLLSERLDVWKDKIAFSFLGRWGWDNLSVFRADNFYIEFLHESGILYFVLFIMFLLYIGYLLKDIYINGYSVVALYSAFLLFCFFDAGMFSTGNLLNLFIWSIIIFALRKRKVIKENFH